jgi:hypothetical protein
MKSYAMEKRPLREELAKVERSPLQQLARLRRIQFCVSLATRSDLAHDIDPYLQLHFVLTALLVCNASRDTIRSHK